MKYWSLTVRQMKIVDALMSADDFNTEKRTFEQNGRHSPYVRELGKRFGIKERAMKECLMRIYSRYGITPRNKGPFSPIVRLVYLRAKELGLLAACLVVVSLTCQAQGAVNCPTTMPHCAQLSWTAPTGTSPTSYNIYHSLTNGGCTTLTASTCLKVGTVNAPTTSFTDGPLVASTQYCFVISAVNTFGESPGSVASCGTTAAGTAPGTPGSIIIQIQ